MSTKKYEIVKSESVVHGGKTLYRIRALKDFANAFGEQIRKGELGGYIESENNLSQKGSCWIYDDAKVYDDAAVYDAAEVFDKAEICNDACISGSAKIYNNVKIFNNARVCDNANICGCAQIFGDAKIFGNARIYGNASVNDDAQIYDNAQVHGFAVVCGKSQIFDNSKLFCNAKIHGYSYIFGNAVVCDDAEILGNVEVSGTAIIFGVAKIDNTKISDNQKIEAGEFMYDAVDITTLLPKVQAMHKQVLRMCAGKYLIDENYLDNIIKEFNEYDKARKVKEELYLVALPLKAGETCALLEEISNALEKIEKSKRFNKEVDNQ